MQVIKLKDNTNIPLCFPQSIKGDMLTYFLKGQGYKKTKKFEVIDTALPDRGADLSWFKICKIMDEYGFYVALEYANNKTAEIVSSVYLNAKYHFYFIAKNYNILEDGFESFLETLPFDYFGALAGKYTLDICKFDIGLSRSDKEYNCVECTYRDMTNVSMKDYIYHKYGSAYQNFIYSVMS